MSGVEADPYVSWDAAYMLGSLSSVDRRAYENHLSGCKQCRSAVSELSGMPALLSLLGREEAASLDGCGPGPLPLQTRSLDGLLDGLLDEVSRRRRRARWRAWMLSAATAAAVIAVALVIAVRPGSGAPPTTDEPPRAAVAPLSMTPVAPSDLAATVLVTSQGWGTRVEMACTYGEHPNGGSPADDGDDMLAMVALGRDGARIELATWRALEGATATPSGSTSMPVGEIAAVQVVSAGTGEVLLQRTL